MSPRQVIERSIEETFQNIESALKILLNKVILLVYSLFILEAEKREREIEYVYVFPIKYINFTEYRGKDRNEI